MHVTPAPRPVDAAEEEAGAALAAAGAFGDGPSVPAPAPAPGSAAVGGDGDGGAAGQPPAYHDITGLRSRGPRSAAAASASAGAAAAAPAAAAPAAASHAPARARARWDPRRLTDALAPPLHSLTRPLPAPLTSLTTRVRVAVGRPMARLAEDPSVLVPFAFPTVVGAFWSLYLLAPRAVSREVAMLMTFLTVVGVLGGGFTHCCRAVRGEPHPAEGDVRQRDWDDRWERQGRVEGRPWHGGAGAHTPAPAPAPAPAHAPARARGPAPASAAGGVQGGFRGAGEPFRLEGQDAAAPADAAPASGPASGPESVDAGANAGADVDLADVDAAAAAAVAAAEREHQLLLEQEVLRQQQQEELLLLQQQQQQQRRGRAWDALGGLPADALQFLH